MTQRDHCINEHIIAGWKWLMARITIPINKMWEFKEVSKNNNDNKPFSPTWLPVAQFPTNIHLDLFHHGKIPDPFFKRNELAVQWVGERAWAYRTQFDVPSRFASDCSLASTVGPGELEKLAQAQNPQVAMVFEGLDTFATVCLNGTVILKADNMFVPKRVNVGNVIKVGAINTIEITFDSAWFAGKKLQEQFPDHFWGCWNGDPSRLGVRKAQYHYGWDWGPTLLTAGPWRPIYMEIYTSRLEDLYFTTEVADSLESVRLVAKADCEGDCTSVAFELSLDGVIIKTSVAAVISQHAEVVFNVASPQLWYPATYGRQPLYHLKATLLLNIKELDRMSKRLGIRKVVVVQRELKDAPGSSFFFEINNVPIFCGGSNWIPADNFIPRISKNKYRSLLRLVRQGNQVMIRVWGGGIYEEEEFYDTADELGILVWQDFQFACGNYPAQIPSFRESVEEEARANVKRLRHHPSIVIFAGNNEDYQLRETENLEYNPDDQDPVSWLKSSFPARYIYEKILVDVMQELAPETCYRFGSPYGGKKTTDPTIGDIHQWNVWHGTQERYQDFDKLSGRFVSEFGMQAFPNVKTIDDFLAQCSTDRYPQSRTMDFHNKAVGHERRLALYLVENVKCTFDPIEQYIYLTQLMQAECLGTAYRLWRRNWKGPGREYTSGALVWQMNDCWPTISWSSEQVARAIVDYHLRPKLAYYAIKQSLAPVVVGAKGEVHEYPGDPCLGGAVSSEIRLYVWASNFLLKAVRARLQIKAFDVISGQQMHEQKGDSVFVLSENRTMELATTTIHGSMEGGSTNRIVVAVYLLDLKGDHIMARFVLWPDVLKYVKVQKPKGLHIDIVEDTVSVSAEIPVKGLTFEKDGVEFDDNLIDLVPGETVSVKARGLGQNESDLHVRYYGQ